MEVFRRVSSIGILGGLIVTVLAVGNLPRPRLIHAVSAVQADDDNRRCSVASLNGTYAMQAQGTIVGQLPSLPSPPFPFAQAGIIAFDGAGNLFGKSTVNLGGLVLQPTFTGTYTVNSDCTGTITVNSSEGLVLHDATVVIRGGRGFRDVQTDPFSVITRSGERLGD